MNTDGWLVRADYVFIEGAPSIDEIDQLVGGKVQHAGGGVRHSLPGGAERAHVEWEFAFFMDARAAITRLRGVRGIDEPALAPTDENRAHNPDAYDVRRADVRGGSCGVWAAAREFPTATRRLRRCRVSWRATSSCSAASNVVSWWLLPDD